jgi:hypothetical protein
MDEDAINIRKAMLEYANNVGAEKALTTIRNVMTEIAIEEAEMAQERKWSAVRNDAVDTGET